MNSSNDRSIVVFTAYALGSMLLATELLAQTFSEQGASILGDVNYNSRSASLADIDNDGDLDLYMTGADGEASKIFRNDGSNHFTDVDTITGHALLSDTSGDLNGARAVDYDNDGDLDLFFHDHKVHSGNDNARKLYRNDGNWEFTDVTAAEGLHATNEGSYDSA
jgi:hypothetical protein